MWRTCSRTRCRSAPSATPTRGYRSSPSASRWFGGFEMPRATDIAPEHYAVLSRVIKGEGCWEWAGAHNQYGYGKFGTRAAHRIIYGYYFGEPSPDLQIDHACGNRGCVNPHHMRAVTP